MQSSNRRTDVRRLFHWTALFVTAGAAAWAVWALINAQFGIAAAMAAVAGFGVALTVPRNRLTPLLRLFLLCAVFVNAAGYALNLWKEGTAFDELMHAFTSFAVTAGVAWLLLSRTSLISGRRTGRLVAVALAIGVALGILWEIFEWLIGIIGSVEDTLADLAMDGIGAVAAGMFCAWAVSHRRSGTD